jgi:hypothetical protein
MLCSVFGSLRECQSQLKFEQRFVLLLAVRGTAFQHSRLVAAILNLIIQLLEKNLRILFKFAPWTFNSRAIME